MPEIEFHTRKDNSEVAGVHIGGQVVVMSPAEWAAVACDILAQVSTHLTPLALDALTLKCVECGDEILPICEACAGDMARQ